MLGNQRPYVLYQSQISDLESWTQFPAVIMLIPCNLLFFRLGSTFSPQEFPGAFISNPSTSCIKLNSEANKTPAYVILFAYN